MSVSCFKLTSDSSYQPYHIDASLNAPPTRPSILTPTFRVLNYDPGHPTPDALSIKSTWGSFEYDQANLYTLSWLSMEEMQIWLRREEAEKTVEFRCRETHRNNGNCPVWVEKHIYLCARDGSGGVKTYMKKNNWDRKVPTKHTGCRCRLTVKTYPDTDVVLGLYQSEHDHAIGNENLRFTRLPEATCLEIERLLRLGVEPMFVVSTSIIIAESLTFVVI